MDRSKYFLSILLGILLATGFSSQVVTDSLPEVLKLTHSSNRQLVLTRANLASQTDSINIATSDLGLNISTVLSGTRDWNLKTNSEADILSGSLVGSYTLSDGNRSKNKVTLEEHIFTKGIHQLHELEQKVLLETIKAYLNVLRDQRLVELTDGNVSVLRRQFEEVKDRFSLGEVTRTDVAQAEAALASAKANLTAKQGALAIAGEIFLTQVGFSPENLEPVKLSFKLPKTIEDATKRALKHHPKLLSVKVQEMIGQLGIDIAKGAKKPIISLRSTLTNGYNQSSGNFNSASIKIEGSIPLFNSGRIDNTVNQAESNLKAYIANSQLAKRNILEEISIAWSNLAVAEATISARKQQIEASKIAYDGVVVEEKLGTRTTLNVINAEQDLLSARTQLASAERDHQFAMFSLLAASGDLNLKYLGIKGSKAPKIISKPPKSNVNIIESFLQDLGFAVPEGLVADK